MSKEKQQQKLTPKQKLFCEMYVSEDFFGNGYAAYCAAYNKEPATKKEINSVKASASENLTKPNLLAYINELLDLAGFNDAHADKQLLFLMTQNNDYSAKLGAIREYNKVKDRITKKVDVNVKGRFYDWTDDQITEELDRLENK